ncbi:MAG: ABC transporter ATP-binding protein [Kiritimatiellia bacterium]
MSAAIQGNPRTVYRRLLRHVRPYAGKLVLAALLGAIGGGSLVALLKFFEKTLQLLFSTVASGFWQMVVVGAAVPALLLLKGAAGYFSVVMIHWVGYRVVTDLRRMAFAHIQKLSLGFFSEQRAGDIVSRIANDASVVQQSVSVVVTDLIKEPFTLLGALSYVIWESVRIQAHWALLSLAIFPVCLLPIIKLGRKIRKYSRQNQEHLADLVGVLQENTGGIRIVKTHCAEAFELSKFSVENERVFSRLMRMARAKFLLQPFMELLTAVSLVFAFGYIKNSGMPMSSFLTIAAGLVMAYQPVKKLGNMHMAIQQSSAAAERIFEVLDTPVEINDRPGAGLLSGPIAGIRFEGLVFTYPGAPEPTLKGIDLEVSGGECIALVGDSGSGKTTLVNLLPRLFEATGGAIRINGTDIRDYTLASLRGRMAMVTQDPFLFNSTLAENIAYGAGTLDMDRVRAAAKKAHAKEFIDALPDGYDTIVGDRGMRLSGGERQRIALARAIYRDAAILILDEATSALDNKSERIVQEAIEETMVGRTVFVIAHRLSTIQNATRIVVLRKGEVAEIGPHQELLERDGIYRHLHDLQFRAFESPRSD